MKTQEKLLYKIYIDSTERLNKKVELRKIIDSTETIVDKEKGDINIVVSIKNILAKNNLAVKDVSEFVPNLGPGSFTGLKMGVTIANVLNWALGKKKLKNLQQPEYGAEPNITKSKRIGI